MYKNKILNGDDMKCSELTLYDVIKYVDRFCPVKIIYNGTVLYNDYDSNMVIDRTEDGEPLYGEIMPPMCVVPDRIQPIDKYIVTSLNIDIVDFHHSVVTIQGKYNANK